MVTSSGQNGKVHLTPEGYDSARQHLLRVSEKRTVAMPTKGAPSRWN